MMDYMDDFEEIVGTQDVSDNIYFICAKRSSMWTPRTVFGLVKDGKFHSISLRKTLYVTPADCTSREEQKQAVRDGRAKKFTENELYRIARNVDYIVPADANHLKRTVEWFVYGRGMDYEYGMEWGRKIKGILNETEKRLFRDFEEMVGYELKESIFAQLHGRNRLTKVYNCEEFELHSALYVVMHSRRLFNCAVYLKENGISEHSLHDVWNYLVSYENHSQIIETMYFSDWVKEDVSDLHEKYNIPDKAVAREDKSFIRRNDATLYESDEYKMAVKISASFDDWDGFAVVTTKDCELSPLEIIEVGESVWHINEDYFVKNKVVRA